MTDLVRLGLVVDSQGFVRAKRDMDGFRKSSADVAKQADVTETRMDSAAAAAMRFGAAIGLVSSSVVGLAIASSIRDVREFESGLINVAKTTGLTGIELDQFADRIEAISRTVPVTTNELLELAMAAGQMGVTGAENLEKFTLTIAKLGRASDLSGEEAAKSLARILNVTGEAVSEIDTLASVIVSLGNNIAASESEIARMTTEVARATSAFGVSSAEAAGMAAAMASIGIRAELGGSSVGRAMQEITSRVQAGGEDLREFARVLNLNSDTLASLFEQNKTAAFEYFLQQVGELGLDAGNALKDVNLGGQEIAKTIVPLSNNMGIFASTMALAAAEVENATALDREFSAQLETMESTLTVTTNILKSAGMALAEDLAGGIDQVLQRFNTFFSSAERFNAAVSLIVEATKMGIGGTATLASSIGDRLVSALRGGTDEFTKAATAGGMLGKLAGTLAGKIQEVTSVVVEDTDALEELDIAYLKVIGSLKDELVMLGMNTKQREIYQAVMKAGVEFGTREAAVIEELIEQRYDEAEALDEYAAAMENAKEQLAEMFELETERSKATSGIISNIDALAREYTALQQGTEAHKAVTRELAIEAAMREAVAQGIIQEADPAYRQLIETQYDLNEAVQGFTEEADPMAESWQAALERVDSAFVDLWKSAFTGFDNFADTLKNAFIQLLAELAHRATTQKIMISLGMGDAGLGGDILGKIPGLSSLTKNTGIDNILKGFGKGDGGFDKTALLDGFKQMGLTIGASWTGGKIGTAIGEGLFNKQAESNIGQTIGSTIGAIWGPLGALAGSSLGSLVDTMTGGDGYKRQNAGFLVGDTPGAKSDYTFAVDDFASGLKVTGLARREEEKVARDLIDTFRQMDAYVVETVKSLGGLIKVTSIDGLNQEATQGSSGTFLGLGRDADLPAQMKYFIDQLADSITGLDQSLIDAVKSASSAEEALAVLGDASRLMSIQVAALGLDATEQARRDFEQQTTLTSIYEQSTQALRDLMGSYDGSIDKTEQLVSTMVRQQESVYNLTLAYLNAQASVDSLFGGLSESIRQSLMSEEELYNYRKKQIEALTGSLETMTDPDKILDSVDSITRQVSELWGSLGEEQRKVMGDEFLGFIEDAQRIAQDRLSGGLAGVETSQSDINLSIQQGIEAASQQMQLASGTILQAAQIFLQGANMTRSAPSVMPGYESNA